MIDKESLARRVDPSGGDTARMIRAEKTEIHQYDTRFFRRGVHLPRDLFPAAAVR